MAYMYLPGYTLGSKLQKICKIPTKFASALYNSIYLPCMLQFPIPDDPGRN